MICPIVKVKPLKGAVINAEKPSFKLKSWFSGDYQEKYEKYTNDNIGFRPWFVKLYNQIQFSMFNEATARGVIRGKDDYLYEINYIKAYNGDDFIGSVEIIENVKNIKWLQDKLSELNKTLLVCVAPGKGSFYPEYFPDNMKKPLSDSTNYKQYIDNFKKYQVNHIDMNKWFSEIKDTSRYILYPKYGIHWSYYGMLLATDSLINYIEVNRNILMPHLEFTKMRSTSKLKYTDYDIAEGMNLLFQMKSEPMCYPEIKFTGTEHSIKPKTLVVSDSFYWSMFNIGIGKDVFSYGGFWFYNKQIYPESFNSPLSVDEIDLVQKVLENEVVILMSTEANLPKFSWEFIENINHALSNNDNNLNVINTQNQELQIRQIIKSIKSNKEWYNTVKQKAKTKDISVDSMLVLDAIWMIKQEK
ncbi:MAG: hypothetical protein PHW82_16185 [Bacteroidales bacterium]|nr:hypothetical protein [Bacteroidales bacterium]